MSHCKGTRIGINIKAISEGVQGAWTPPKCFQYVLFLTKYQNLNSIKLQFTCFGYGLD